VRVLRQARRLLAGDLHPWLGAVFLTLQRPADRFEMPPHRPPRQEFRPQILRNKCAQFAQMLSKTVQTEEEYRLSVTY